MRVKSKIWISAYLRRAMSVGVFGYIAKSGDEDAGAIYIHIDHLGDDNRLFGPAPAGLDGVSHERRWVSIFTDEPVLHQKIEDYLQSQRRFDPDLWVVTLEDRQGRHFLDDELVHIEC